MYVLGDLTLTHVTVTENHVDGADSTAGGVFAGASSAISLDHSIVAKNLAAAASPDLKQVSGSVDSGYSFVGSNEGISLEEASVAFPDEAGNMVGGSVNGLIDPKLFPLEFNEGDGDTHLPQPDSPVLNAGDQSAIAGNNGIPNSDQRGVGFSRVRDGRIDIGAIELGLLRVDTLVDENDGDHSEGDFSLREALSLILNTAERDILAFDPTLFQNGAATITLTQGELEVVDKVTIFGPKTKSLTISAEGNDPTPGDNKGDGSRIFTVLSVPRTGSPLGTFPFLQIHNLALTGGDVDGSGGAIHVSPGGVIFNSNAAALHNSVVYDNHATEEGGGIYTANGTALLEIDNSTLTGNSSGGEGGAIAGSVFSIFVDGVLTRGLRIESSTITQNISSQGGGGIALITGGATIENTIVAGNSSSESESADLIQTNFNSSTDYDFSHSLIGVGHNSIISGAPLGFPDSDGNLVGSSSVPINPLLGPLSNNGGPTQTHALLPGSPALDAGDSAEMSDQRGLTAPLDLPGIPNAEGGNGSDIGAYEAQSAPSADFVDDDIITGFDFLVWQRGFNTSTGAVRSNGNADDDGDVDASDLVAWELTYGQAEINPLVTALSPGVPQAVERVTSPELIDAVMAMPLIVKSVSGEEVVDLQEQPLAEVSSRPTSSSNESAMPVDISIYSVARSTASGEPDKTIERRISDDAIDKVFQRVFG